MGFGKRNIRVIIYSVLGLAGVCLLGMGVVAKYQAAQYKRQGRDAMSRIVDGKGAELIEPIEAYLAKEQANDLESMFFLAMLYSQEGDIDKAMKYVRGAVENGMDAGRFIAGPREHFKKLYDSKEYKDYIRDNGVSLLHGPAVGAVTDTQAMFWVRTAGESKVKVMIGEYPKSGTGRVRLRESEVVETKKEDDYTAIVEVSGLKPDTRYSYHVQVDGKIAGKSGEFRTFATAQNGAKFSVGFGGGAGYTPQYERMWKVMDSHDLLAFLALGDNVYIDDPEKPAVQRYCYYRRQSQEHYRRFVSRVPSFSIWDDHDFTVNDGWGGPDIEEPKWKRDVWEVYKQNWVNPSYGGGKSNPGCWYDFYISDVHFIMLDCRYYRERAKGAVNPSMLGGVQKKWLLETLKNSKGTFKVLASSVPWSLETKPGSLDTWKGHEAEREEIFSFIEANKINGIFLISADRHRSDAWKIERANGYDFYEFESSKLTNIHTHKKMPGSMFSYNEKCSFGKLNFDTTKADAEVVYEIYSIDNEKVYEFKLKASQLKR